jgi:peroxiredoxin
MNTVIVAVSTDPIEKAHWSKEKIKIPFPVLSDVKRTAMNLYNTRSLSTYKGPDGGLYNHATLILVDSSGTIRWIYRNPDYRVRATVEDDLAQIRKLQGNASAPGKGKLQ